MRFKKTAVALLALCALAGLLLVADTLLQPKVRVVPLEGVPVSPGSPDVTFMLGVSMDPPVQTNPFLVIFSPIERLTDKTRVVAGSLKPLSDTETIFVWDAFGIRSTWRLDRAGQRLAPVADPRGLHPAGLCTRLFPTLVFAFRRESGSWRSETGFH
ncbi:MAG: hypothetical protein A3G34_14440 [Candidatus Lindowbacteria bacterium RIFCSPLOWO2_12_FULL_62_27]|nr:MAG: hypothetical protein A3I06_16915 [Candidatus Lindowbacteria bacterium RIFCSPLOWO2_02_FULL_62_12]OGH62759.1 MAG: hypothetical protein A3G34_14440 [Candidatus Lindowbacteria bacterium RIFCSPLOWO2_12_FULL_62_27]